MLRTHLLKIWYALSDRAMDEASYDSQATRHFVGVDVCMEGSPDETTIGRSRRLLERQHSAPRLFAVFNAHLRANWMRLSTGTIVDATNLSSPWSIKNNDRRRDPRMHQTRKGKPVMLQPVGADRNGC